MGKINYGCIFVTGITEWSCFLLSRVIRPKFAAGTVKIPHEHDSEYSLCWPRFVPGTSRKQATRFTYWAKCITNIRDIHCMCTNMDQYMWMTPKYGIVWMIPEYGTVESLQIFSEVPPLILDQETACPGWCFSWTFWIPSGEWTVLQSGQDRFLTKPYYLSYPQHRDTQRHTL